MSKKKLKMNKIIKQINQDLDKIDMYKIGKSLESDNINNGFNFFPTKLEEDNNFRITFNSEIDTSSIHSNFSNFSKKTNMTMTSKPYNLEKDLDLPNFTSTKYYKFSWRFCHSTTYFLYSFFLLLSSFYLISNEEKYKEHNIVMLIAHIFYCISTFIQWFYYKRGCIGYANHNSKLKKNIDQSFRARILRGEEGWKYFFSFIASIILIYGNIYYFVFCEVLEPDFWNINLIGSMIISLTQILKMEKILTKNKQYFVVNDLSNSFVEIFLFFGSLSFGSSYLIQITYNYSLDYLNTLLMSLKLVGNTFIIFSAFCLIHRYFCSNYDDLNVSSLSNLTL